VRSRPPVGDHRKARNRPSAPHQHGISTGKAGSPAVVGPPRRRPHRLGCHPGAWRADLGEV